MITATINGRVYQLTESEKDHPNFRAHLIKNGFDGTVWYGFSPRTGRQRKDLYSLVHRTQSGEFVIGVTV